MEPTGGGAARREEGGVDGKEEVCEETKGNMVDWMCHSRPVGRTVAAQRRHAGL